MFAKVTNNLKSQMVSVYLKSYAPNIFILKVSICQKSKVLIFPSHNLSRVKKYIFIQFFANGRVDLVFRPVLTYLSDSN